MVVERLISAWRKNVHFRGVSAAGTALGLALAGGVAQANPTGGVVVHGQAAITQTNPSKVTITQTTQNAAINWKSFNIGTGETTAFVQPNASSIALNRVTGGNPSQILGNLTSNGQVWLVNPSGVFFGKTATIDVAGLLATTSNISDANFAAKKYVFDQPSPSAAAIQNDGAISVIDTGLVALAGPTVVNTGTITARLGQVTLASTATFTIDLGGDGRYNFAVGSPVNQAGSDTAVTNSGSIIADGGTVTLTANDAASVVDHAINQTGLIQAQTAGSQNGQIVLSGGQSGDITIGGLLDSSGDGNSTGGTISITGSTSVAVQAGSNITASGGTGGGAVSINATDITLDATSAVGVDATTSGNGGRLTLKGLQSLTAKGQLSAQSGFASGNGGLIETSASILNVSHPVLVSSRSPFGVDGSWKLDPENVVIEVYPTGSLDKVLHYRGGVNYCQAGETVCTIGDVTFMYLSGEDNFYGSKSLIDNLNNKNFYGLPDTLNGGMYIYRGNIIITAVNNIYLNSYVPSFGEIPPYKADNNNRFWPEYYGWAVNTEYYPPSVFAGKIDLTAGGAINANIVALPAAEISLHASEVNLGFASAVISPVEFYYAKSPIPEDLGPQCCHVVLNINASVSTSIYTRSYPTYFDYIDMLTTGQPVFESINSPVIHLYTYTVKRDITPRAVITYPSEEILLDVSPDRPNILASSALNAFTGNAGGYVILTIPGEIINIVADPISKDYGKADPALTYTCTEGGSACPSSITFSGALSRDSGENVGTYNINQGTLAASGYSINFTAATLTITQLKLLLSGSQAYNGMNIVLGSNLEAMNVVPGDVVVIGGSATMAGKDVLPLGDAQPLTDLSGLTVSNPNYTLDGASGFVKVTPAAVTVTASSNTKTYDGKTTADATPTVTSGQFYDPVTLSETYSDKSAGTNLAINPTATVNNPIDYNITYVSSTSGVINPATLTYTADPATRYFLTQNPTFTGTVTGFVNGESQQTATTGKLLFSSPADASSPAGSYGVNGSGLAAYNGNYIFQQALSNGSALTIKPASVDPSLVNQITTVTNTVNTTTDEAVTESANSTDQSIENFIKYYLSTRGVPSPSSDSDPQGWALESNVMNALSLLSDEALPELIRNQAGSVSDIDLARIMLSRVVNEREERGKSLDITLRDSEYYLRNYIGGYYLLHPLECKEYCVGSIVFQNPLATGTYNFVKGVLNTVGAGSVMQATANPNATPGGDEAALNGFMAGATGAPLIVHSNKSPSDPTVQQLPLNMVKP